MFVKFVAAQSPNRHSLIPSHLRKRPEMSTSDYRALVGLVDFFRRLCAYELHSTSLF
jgi:hypothetical protein